MAREPGNQIIKRFDRQLRTTHEIILPFVHINGDSQERLIEYREDVCGLLRKVQDAMAAMSPNARNYYFEDGLIDKAVEQHRQRNIAVHTLLNDLEYEMGGILDDDFKGDD